MNKERFCAVLAHIEAHPEEWRQDIWCGTSCCFAGHAVAMFGPEPEREYARAENDGGGLAGGPSIPERAQTLLGLSDDEEAWLFAGERKIEDFREVAESGELPERAYCGGCGDVCCTCEDSEDEDDDWDDEETAP